jgi:hypothetical protein
MQGADWYAATNGTSTGDGSLAHPLDLTTALNGVKVQAGDTLWLRGGVYQGTFYSSLAGQANLLITVRQYPGERATVDGGIAQSTGGYTIYWGFEVMNSHPKRVSKKTAPSPSDLPVLAGFNLRAPNIHLVNMIIHDALGEGCGVWSEAPDSEVTGCLIYNCGWQGKDHGWGHGIYAQNQTGAKHLTDNIIFNQYGNGIQVYGSSAAYLINFTIEGNALINNGNLSLAGDGNNLTLYGGSPAQGIIVTDNLSYNNKNGKAAIQIGSTGVAGVTNVDVVIQNNYFVELMRVAQWHQATVMTNIMISPNTVMELDQTLEPLRSLGYTWNNNVYYSQEFNGALPFILNTNPAQSLSWSGWQQATGFDSRSQYTKGQPTGTLVVLQPNQYEAGRANIMVYNWALQSQVAVDVSSVVAIGASYEVRNAQDWYAGPILSGTYSGQPLSLPMTGLTVAKPIALNAPPPTGPQFNAFVITSK